MGNWFHFLLHTPLQELDINRQKMIYISFHRLVYRDVYSITHDHLTTEDIIHDAFIKILTKNAKIRSQTNIQAWLKKITRNIALDHLRKSKRERQFLSNPFNYVVIHNDYYEKFNMTKEIEDKFKNNVLHQAILELKPEYQTVLILFYIHEKSYREISQELHLTESVLTQRLARARKKLLQQFSKKWYPMD
nr:sigma-70 family RNA polymerase sigma factor [Paenibacillus xylanexedens]